MTLKGSFVLKLPSYGRMSMVSLAVMSTTERYSSTSRSQVGTVEKSNSSGTCEFTGASKNRRETLCFYGCDGAWARVWVSAGVGLDWERVVNKKRPRPYREFGLHFEMLKSNHVRRRKNARHPCHSFPCVFSLFISQSESLLNSYPN